MGRLALALALVVGLTGAAVAAPRIELITMGAGDDVFSKFGHAAICVFSAGEVDGTCYNYGTADFSTPGPLTWNFIRGRAEFWVSTMRWSRLLEVYEDYDRTIYRQVLPLSDHAAEGLARRLEMDRLPENRFYLYHHFHDNCTTRLRDHIDQATGGVLRKDADAPYSRTYREMVRAGFAGNAGLLALAELLMGRVADARPTLWEAMFHPDVLRLQVWKRLGARPEAAYQRRKPLASGSLAAGRWVLLGLAAGLGVVVTAGALSGRRWARRVGLVAAGLCLGALALLLDGLALLSTMRELTRNELLLVFWPTDLALVALDGRWLRGYLLVRLGALALVALAALVGVLVQPLWAPLAIVALPVGALAAIELRRARKPAEVVLTSPA